MTSNQVGWTNMMERRDKLKDLVGNKYPWAEVICSKPDCLICRSSLNQLEKLPPQYRPKVGKCHQKET